VKRLGGLDLKLNYENLELACRFAEKNLTPAFEVECDFYGCGCTPEDGLEELYELLIRLPFAGSVYARGNTRGCEIELYENRVEILFENFAHDEYLEVEYHFLPSGAAVRTTSYGETEVLKTPSVDNLKKLLRSLPKVPYVIKVLKRITPEEWKEAAEKLKEKSSLNLTFRELNHPIEEGVSLIWSSFDAAILVELKHRWEPLRLEEVLKANLC
jgi:hypothetical protein